MRGFRGLPLRFGTIWEARPAWQPVSQSHTASLLLGTPRDPSPSSCSRTPPNPPQGAKSPNAQQGTEGLDVGRRGGGPPAPTPSLSYPGPSALPAPRIPGGSPVLVPGAEGGFGVPPRPAATRGCCSTTQRSAGWPWGRSPAPQLLPTGFSSRGWKNFPSSHKAGDPPASSYLPQKPQPPPTPLCPLRTHPCPAPSSWVSPGHTPQLNSKNPPK